MLIDYIDWDWLEILFLIKEMKFLIGICNVEFYRIKEKVYISYGL